MKFLLNIKSVFKFKQMAFDLGISSNTPIGCIFTDGHVTPIVDLRKNAKILQNDPEK